MAESILQPSVGVMAEKPNSTDRKITPLTNALKKSRGAEKNQNIHELMADGAGKGSALDADVGSQMSDRFGFDFGSVKIHADDHAAQLSHNLNARAFTVGTDIYFNKGLYNPGSTQGKQLLTHELTHVVQQNGVTNHLQKDEKADAEAAEAKMKTETIAKIKLSGIISVDDGDVNFTSGELDLVYKAIAALPEGDKTAIKGAKIIRVSSLGGNAGGRYSNKQGLENDTVTDEQKIELSDKAFGGNISAAESIRLVTHEVGHAVASMPQKVAKTDEIKAVVKSNALVEESNVAVAEFNSANDTSNTTIEAYNASVEVYNSAIKGTDKGAIATAKADMAAKKVTVDKLQSERGTKEKIYDTKKAAVEEQKKVVSTKAATSASKIANIDDLKKDASTKLTSMESASKSAHAILGKDDAESADYRASLKAAETAIKTFYDENVTVDVEEATADAAKSVVDAALKERNTKRDVLNKLNPKNTITGSTSALEASQDSCFKSAVIVAFNKSMALSVRKFYDLVISNGISPALTPYAAANWPHKPEEFYAEAYSFYVTKPKDLEAYSNVLYDWFKAGSYK